jgi:hypothetical protein
VVTSANKPMSPRKSAAVLVLFVIYLSVRTPKPSNAIALTYR